MDSEMQLLIIYLAIIAVLLVFMGFLLRWFSKHNILVQVTEKRDGVFFVRSMRCRMPGNRKLYSVYDFFRWRPLPVVVEGKPIHDQDSDVLSHYYIAYESMPIFGVKKVIKTTKVRSDDFYNQQNVDPNFQTLAVQLESIGLAKFGLERKASTNTASKDKYLYIPWLPPNKIETTGLVSDFLYMITLQRRIDFYDMTKSESTAELLAKIALPIGLAILAIFMLVYFDKLYEIVTRDGLSALGNSINALGNLAVGPAPPG